MVQVTAASLVAENRVLATPASPGTITTSGNKEDFVSMGMTAALKLRDIVSNTRLVLAMEALAAARALDYLAPSEIEPGNRSGPRETARGRARVGRRSGIFGTDPFSRRVDCGRRPHRVTAHSTRDFFGNAARYAPFSKSRSASSDTLDSRTSTYSYFK